MPPLSLTQLNSLARLLDEREFAAQVQIRAEAGRRADEPFAELTGDVSDLGDEASADVIVDIDNAMMGLQLTQLQDIAAARKRMKDKRYGVCIDCEDEIEYARLQAYPTAKRCTACQRIRERSYASEKHTQF